LGDLGVRPSTTKPDADRALVVIEARRRPRPRRHRRSPTPTAPSSSSKPDVDCALIVFVEVRRRPRPHHRRQSPTLTVPLSSSKPDADCALVVIQAGHHRDHPRPSTPSAIIRVKGHLDLDRSDLFIKRHTRKDGKPTNEVARHVIEKLKSLKSVEPPSDDSTPHQVAARNDTYTQVLGSDRPGRVSGVGIGPTPTSMWGNESKEVLRTENRLFMQRMEELETAMAEKFAKMESMIRGSQVYMTISCFVSMDILNMNKYPSAVEGQTVDQDVKCIIDCGDVSKLIGKRVLLVNIEMQHVADGILISIEIEKVVMGRKIGTEYCEMGMLLFLFEYEERKLYGVFEATSDGAMDIVPMAFSSLGKLFSAQIQVSFRIIWRCPPLTEGEFFDAIKENYHAPKKVHLHLSGKQVWNLFFFYCISNGERVYFLFIEYLQKTSGNALFLRLLFPLIVDGSIDCRLLLVDGIPLGRRPILTATSLDVCMGLAARSLDVKAVYL
ncbi:hypothetical protein Taro_045779, partial [Colocasia esculenta]|nr:hypothetical protein [Colocasia esculenta]